MHTHPTIHHLLCLAAVGVAVCGLSAARAQTVPAAPPAELARSAEIYAAEMIRLSSQHNDMCKGLPRQYLADLAELQKKVQESGDLDGMLAIAKESKRFAAALAGERDPFEPVPEMPESALVTTPDVLRNMQAAYLKRSKESADLLRRRLTDLTTLYIKGLEGVQKELTRNNRIADAVVVRHEVERLRKNVTNDQFMAQALIALTQSAATNGAGILPPAGGAPGGAGAPAVYGTVPDWAKWGWEKTENYAQEGYLFAHPDLPNELEIDFNHKTGRGRVSGRCYYDRMVVDMRERNSFGKAIMWQITNVQTLNATFQLQSKEISVGQNYGPTAQLVLFADKTPLLALTVPLMATETTLRVVKDPEGNRCALMWLQGKRTEKVNLPDTGTLHLLFAITVRNPGERCDTSIVMQ